jgi:hypothetical protein
MIDAMLFGFDFSKPATIRPILLHPVWVLFCPYLIDLQVDHYLSKF